MAAAAAPVTPAGEENHGMALVHVLSCVLSRLVAANDKMVAAGGAAVTKFHALRPPSISIRDYLERILKYASCSDECFVLALVYIDRLIQRHSFVLSSLNVHRIIITSVMLAAKFFDDQYFNNAYYAKVGGVPCNEINSLELEFLFSVNFALHVAPDVYAKYEKELLNHMSSSVPCECNPHPRGVVDHAAAHAVAHGGAGDAAAAIGTGGTSDPAAAAAVAMAAEAEAAAAAAVAAAAGGGGMGGGADGAGDGAGAHGYPHGHGYDGAGYGAPVGYDGDAGYGEAQVHPAMYEGGDGGGGGGGGGMPYGHDAPVVPEGGAAVDAYGNPVMPGGPGPFGTPTADDDMGGVVVGGH